MSLDSNLRIKVEMVKREPEKETFQKTKKNVDECHDECERREFTR